MAAVGEEVLFGGPGREPDPLTAHEIDLILHGVVWGSESARPGTDHYYALGELVVPQPLPISVGVDARPGDGSMIMSSQA